MKMYSQWELTSNHIHDKYSTFSSNVSDMLNKRNSQTFSCCLKDFDIDYPNTTTSQYKFVNNKISPYQRNQNKKTGKIRK